MDIELVTPATALPVALDDFKAHAKIELDDEDELLLSYLETATEHAESYTGRQLVTATWKLVLDGFGEAIDKHGEIRLPKAPLLAISSIAYLDSAGASQTWASTDYQYTSPAGPYALQGRLRPIPAGSWPTTEAGRMAAVTITYTAGYGDPDDVPHRIRQAIRLYAAELYARREPAIVGTIVAPASLTVERLLARFRCF